jgi:hypothetical protein
MERSPSGEADSSSASQNISNFRGNGRLIINVNKSMDELVTRNA